jgi:chromosome segregation ATPase
MTEDEMRALRLLIREETNAAVYASEERVVAYVRPLTQQIEGMQGAMERLQGNVEGMQGVMKRLQGNAEGMQGVMKRLQGNAEEMQGAMERLQGNAEGMQRVMERLNERMGRLEIRVDRLETDQRDIKATLIRFEANLSETISVIDDVTNVINDLQASQRSLELKLEDNISGMRKELLRLNESIHTFARQFIALHIETNDRITLHERTHISETHPKPHSAA